MCATSGGEPGGGAAGGAGGVVLCPLEKPQSGGDPGPGGGEYPGELGMEDTTQADCKIPKGGDGKDIYSRDSSKSSDSEDDDKDKKCKKKKLKKKRKKVAHSKKSLL